MTSHTNYFDEHGLANRCLDGLRLIVFTGCSGSGKSTAIDFLLHNNPGFSTRPYSTITGGPVNWARWNDPAGLEEIIVIDELLSPFDLWPVLKLLRRGHRVIVANHVPTIYFKWLGWFWPTQHFVTDTNPEKIEHYLKCRGLQYSPQAVEHYSQRFGANFTDVDIILERYPLDNFDHALSHYLRFCRHRLTPVGFSR